MVPIYQLINRIIIFLPLDKTFMVKIMLVCQKEGIESDMVNTVTPRPSSPVRQDGERRTTFLDEYALRRVPFFLVLAHFIFCLPLIFNLLMQSSITLVARVIHRPT